MSLRTPRPTMTSGSASWGVLEVAVQKGISKPPPQLHASIRQIVLFKRIWGMFVGFFCPGWCLLSENIFLFAVFGSLFSEQTSGHDGGRSCRANTPRGYQLTVTSGGVNISYPCVSFLSSLPHYCSGREWASPFPQTSVVWGLWRGRPPREQGF